MIQINERRSGMYYYIRKISVRSVAMYTFILVFILTFVLTLFFWPVFSTILKMMPNDPVMDEKFNLSNNFLSPFSLVVIPLLTAVLSTLVNIIIVVCYNLLSIKLRGIKIHLKEIEKTSDRL